MLIKEIIPVTNKCKIQYILLGPLKSPVSINRKNHIIFKSYYLFSINNSANIEYKNIIVIQNMYLCMNLFMSR